MKKQIDDQNKMGIFQWSNYFEVGVKDIDEQHQVLVSLINALCSNALNGHDDSGAIASIFDELVDYTKYHFDFEEKLYQSSNIPTAILDEHKECHSKLISQVILLNKEHDFKLGSTDNLDTVLTTLVLWLSDHILKNDMRMCMMIPLFKKGMDSDSVIQIVDK